MLDELWADVEAEFGRRPPKERLADWPKEMKEPAERVTKCVSSLSRRTCAYWPPQIKGSD